MQNDLLALPHNKFYFQITRGQILSTKQWSESRTDGGGYHNKYIITNVSNHLEFWLKKEDGKEVSYRANADQLSLREGQNVELLEVVINRGRKKGQSQLVAVHNINEDAVWEVMPPYALGNLEAPIFFPLLKAYFFVGFIGWFSPTFGLLHVLSLLIGVPYLWRKKRFYKKKLDAIADAMRAEDSAALAA